MNESALMVVLRLFHIISGVFWAGGAMLMAWFVLPSQGVLGQTAAMFMRELMMRRRLRIYLGVSMILTLLSGIWMYVRLAMITDGAWASSITGMVLGAGALAAIVAGGIGGSAGARAEKRMAALGARIQAAGGTPTEDHKSELTEILRRMTKAMRIVAALLLITLASMASARYL